MPNSKSSNFKNFVATKPAKKKIAIIGSYAGSLISFRGNLLVDLQKNHYEVIVLLPDINKHPTVASRLDCMGIKFFGFPLKGNRINPFSDIKSLICISRILKRESVSALLLYTIKPVIYGSIVGRLLGIRKIFSIITGVGFVFTGKDSVKGRIVKFIVKTLYKFAFLFNKAIFFQNKDDLNLFIDLKLINRQNTLLTNGSGVDLDYYAPESVVSKVTNFLFIGRLLGDKGIREFIIAAAEVKAINPNVTFSVCGWIDHSPDAITQNELDAWITQGVINYLGKMEDVRPAIAESSVMVLPSYREGTPRSVLEAMSMGKPIITCDVPGCRETVIDGINGYLVPHKSPKSLVLAMEKFISNPKDILDMGYNSRLIASEKFNVIDVNKIILNAIET
jgi:glycosyltransferase involved in cell wall biosynthesis